MDLYQKQSVFLEVPVKWQPTAKCEIFWSTSPSPVGRNKNKWGNLGKSYMEIGFFLLRLKQLKTGGNDEKQKWRMQ